MPKKPKDLAEEIVQEIIRIFAKREDPEHFRVIFATVAGRKEITYGKDRKQYNNFLDTCQRRFFRRLDTNEKTWQFWPREARRYLGIEEVLPQLEPVVLRKQDGLLF